MINPYYMSFKLNKFGFPKIIFDQSENFGTLIDNNFDICKLNIYWRYFIQRHFLTCFVLYRCSWGKLFFWHDKVLPTKHERDHHHLNIQPGNSENAIFTTLMKMKEKRGIFIKTTIKTLTYLICLKFKKKSIW